MMETPTSALKTLTDSMIVAPEDSYTYDELTRKRALGEVLDQLKSTTSISDETQRFINAIFSTNVRFAPSIDMTSYGLGYITALADILALNQNQ